MRRQVRIWSVTMSHEPFTSHQVECRVQASTIQRAIAKVEKIVRAEHSDEYETREAKLLAETTD